MTPLMNVRLDTSARESGTASFLMSSSIRVADPCASVSQLVQQHMRHEAACRCHTRSRVVRRLCAHSLRGAPAAGVSRETAVHLGRQGAGCGCPWRLVRTWSLVLGPWFRNERRRSKLKQQQTELFGAV